MGLAWSSMRIGAIIRSYYLTDYLERVVKNYSWIDRVVVANFMFPRVDSSVRDKTESIINKLNQPNVVLLKDRSRHYDQAEVFEMAKNKLLDCDLIFISDADEFLLKSDQEKIINDLNPNSEKALCHVIDYCLNTDYAFPLRTHKPIVAVRPKVRFVGTRDAEGQGQMFNDIYMHHFGYSIKEQEWKRENIWYPSHSYDEIVCNTHTKYKKPDELHKLLVCTA